MYILVEHLIKTNNFFDKFIQFKGSNSLFISLLIFVTFKKRRNEISEKNDQDSYPDTSKENASAIISSDTSSTDDGS